jgi:hypothetical protein
MTTDERLNRLEKSARRWKSSTLMLGAIVSALGLCGAAKEQAGEYTAQRFVLVDEKGTARAALGMFNGSPSLTFFNDFNGQRRVAMIVGLDPVQLGGGPAIRGFDTAEQEKMRLRLSENGQPEMFLTGPTSRSTAVITFANGKPFIGIVHGNWMTDLETLSNHKTR